MAENAADGGHLRTLQQARPAQNARSGVGQVPAGLAQNLHGHTVPGLGSGHHFRREACDLPVSLGHIFVEVSDLVGEIFPPGSSHSSQKLGLGPSTVHGPQRSLQPAPTDVETAAFVPQPVSPAVRVGALTPLVHGQSHRAAARNHNRARSPLQRAGPRHHRIVHREPRRLQLHLGEGKRQQTLHLGCVLGAIQACNAGYQPLACWSPRLIQGRPQRGRQIVCRRVDAHHLKVGRPGQSFRQTPSLQVHNHGAGLGRAAVYTDYHVHGRHLSADRLQAHAGHLGAGVGQDQGHRPVEHGILAESRGL